MPETNKFGRICALLVTAAVLGCSAEAQEIVVVRGGQTSPTRQQAGVGPRIIEIPSQRASSLRGPQLRPSYLVDLLSDHTLRVGDIAMFPDGPRVFTGHQGSAHRLGEFERVTAGTRIVPPALRSYLLSLPKGYIPGWIAAEATGTTQAAATPSRRTLEILRPPTR